MTAETLKLYKLIILYFLIRSRQAVPNTIISDFILETGYTDYLSIQETLTSLSEDNMITGKQTHSSCYYEITPAGMETYNYFGNQLPADTKKQIEEYLQKNRLEIAEETAVRTDYTRVGTGEYQASCSLWEHNIRLYSLTLNLPDEAAAQDACRNFREKSGEIYEYLLHTLR